jgi:Tfp pilus assembly protein PilZ
MKYLFPLVAGFSVISGLVMADGRVRRISVQGDQIVTVRTALGVATIIQVPDKPNSVVVGDLSAYKVEYLDTAITIKPMSGHAKSNLYIYTDYKRFNVQLVTGSEASADYVVYLENLRNKSIQKVIKDKPEVIWTSFLKTMTNEAITIQVNRVGETAHGLCFIDFTIKSRKNETILPEWFWLTQNGTSHTIQGLILSSLTLNANQSKVHGTIEVLKADLDQNKPMRVELRRKKTSSLNIKGVNGWKH